MEYLSPTNFKRVQHCKLLALAKCIYNCYCCCCQSVALLDKHATMQQMRLQLQEGSDYSCERRRQPMCQDCRRQQRSAVCQHCVSRHNMVTSSTSCSSSSSTSLSHVSGRREALLAAALVLQLPGLTAGAAPAQAAQLQPWRSCFTMADIQADYDR
jgi:hypothetical protein